MASSYADLIDAVLADLRTEVFPSIREDEVHRYTEIPAGILTDDGNPHLACWLVPRASESARPLTAGSFGGSVMLTQVFALMYWEPSGGQDQDLKVLGPEGATKLLGLSDAVKRRLYIASTQSLAGAFSIDYRALTAYGLVRDVRYIGWTFSVDRPFDWRP